MADGTEHSVRMEKCDMVSMILKMSGMTVLYTLLTVLLYKRTSDKPMNAPRKIIIGIIFGFCSMLSTHFGVDYNHMMVNVRDIGPLAAGLFFHPVSGIIAGLIGGIERYIAGTYWGVGSYTTIACSVSTCLAGFVAALTHIYVFNRNKPNGIYAFFIGAVMEVFHMYAVLITHRNDMEMAFYVVRTCAIPMITFTGLGMAASAIVLEILSGEWKNPLRRRKSEEMPVTHKFETWLFFVTASVLVINWGFTFLLQTQSARQSARYTLTDASEDIAQNYSGIRRTQEGIANLLESLVLTDTRAIARAINGRGGVETVDASNLESWRELYGLESVCLVSQKGALLASAGESPLYMGLLDKLADGDADYQTARLSASRVVAGARCRGALVQCVIDEDDISRTLNQSGLYDSLSRFHVGSAGGFDIVSPVGYSIGGDHRSQILNEWNVAVKRLNAGETFFTEEMFNIKSLCRVERLEDRTLLLAHLPESEVYANRDMQAYETALADILLFAVIYLLISVLVRQVVVNNIQRVNASLDRITGGDLNEVVNVRSAAEFASLSDDINHTVSVLKGYIADAKKRIEQELEFAKSIQDAALPKHFKYPREDFELYAMMDPAKEVGGDFYDFFFVDNDHMGLVIADVSGKGIPAALFMMRAKTAMRSLAESGRAPSEILFRANNTLCDGNDAEMFVTAWIGIIDLNTGEMRCANAGHEYPMVMRAGGEYTLFKDKHGLALGAMEGMRFAEYEMKLDPGDRLFVYTDGVPEAINVDEQQYGTDRLTWKLNTLRNASMPETLPAVRQDVADFAGSAEQFDDITMLGFAYYGAEGRQAS